MAGGTLTDADTRYLGGRAYDFAGCSVAGAGDVNDDGFDDMLIGAYGNDAAGDSAGRAHLVLGAETPASGNLSTDAIQYTGEAGGDIAGFVVAGAGDYDGDGHDDMIIGADAADGSAGAAYLILGTTDTPSMSLAVADARYAGAVAGDHAGTSVGGGGDVNADGYNDLLIGAVGADFGAPEAGAAYLVLGASTPDAGGLESVATLLYDEVADAAAGRAVAIVGDVDLDGFDDMLVGAYHTDASTGAAHLIFGASGISASSLTEGVQFTGEAAGDYGGFAVSGGDANADGYADLLLGSLFVDGDVPDGGAAYLILGGWL